MAADYNHIPMKISHTTLRILCFRNIQCITIHFSYKTSTYIESVFLEIEENALFTLEHFTKI